MLNSRRFDLNHGRVSLKNCPKILNVNVRKNTAEKINYILDSSNFTQMSNVHYKFQIVKESCHMLVSWELQCTDDQEEVKKVKCFKIFSERFLSVCFWDYFCKVLTSNWDKQTPQWTNVMFRMEKLTGNMLKFPMVDASLIIPYNGSSKSSLALRMHNKILNKLLFNCI